MANNSSNSSNSSSSHVLGVIAVIAATLTLAGLVLDSSAIALPVVAAPRRQQVAEHMFDSEQTSVCVKDTNGRAACLTAQHVQSINAMKDEQAQYPFRLDPKDPNTLDVAPGASLCFGDVCMRGVDPDNVAIWSRATNGKIAQLGTGHDRLMVYQKVDGRPPYFYYNRDGWSGVHQGPPNPNKLLMLELMDVLPTNPSYPTVGYTNIWKRHGENELFESITPAKTPGGKVRLLWEGKVWDVQYTGNQNNSIRAYNITNAANPKEGIPLNTPLNTKLAMQIIGA